MKRTIIILSTLLVCKACYASLFGISADLFNRTTNDLKANDVTLGSKIDKIGIDLSVRLGDIEAKVNAQTSAIVGVNNKVSNISSGRDTNQTKTTTNDTGLMKEMINTYRAIIVLLIGQLCMLLKMYINNDAKRDAWTEKYIEQISNYTKGKQVIDQVLKESENIVKEGVK